MTDKIDMMKKVDGLLIDCGRPSQVTGGSNRGIVAEGSPPPNFYFPG
jgi:hypothetical protein